MKKALIIGATGLVGGSVVNQLLNDERYSVIKVFTRKTLGLNHAKLQEHIVDFEKMELWKKSIHGDELFSAMGTTIKKAGSKEAQYKIDFTYQYECAKAASENGVGKYLLVSSAGANSKSANFYLRIKGELDEKVSELSFEHINIFRPSILAGKRNERRIGEELGASIIKFFTQIIPPLRKYRPINVETVAGAMIKAANQENNIKLSIYELEKIFQLVLKNR